MIVTIDARLPAWGKLESAFVGLAGDKRGAAALGGIEVTRFERLDTKALAAARKAYKP